MASVQDSRNFVEFDEYVEYQLEKTRQGVKWTDILAGLAGVAVLILGYMFVFVLADHWLFEGGVPGYLRVGAFCVVVAAAVLWLAFRAVWPFFRQINDLYAARMLENAEPELRGYLLGLIDSRRGGRMPAEEVRKALEKRSATTLSGMDVEAALDRRNLMRIAYVLLAVVLIACAYAVLAPKRIGPSLLRAMIPGTSIDVATRTEILDVKPGEVTVLAGARLDISVRLGGEHPEKVWLYLNTADRRFVDEPVQMRLIDQTTHEYQTTLIGPEGRGLRQDLTYRIEAGDADAGPFPVHVGLPPIAKIESLALNFPDYTEQPSQTLKRPPIEAVEGTRLELVAKANRPLSSAVIEFSDKADFRQHAEEIPLSVSEDGMTVSADWTLTLREDGSSPNFFRIVSRDRKGRENPYPTVYPIVILADEPPEIALHDPRSDIKRPANAIVPLLVSARDPDYELREITLHVEKNNDAIPGRTVLWEGEASATEFRHKWALEELGLQPGDELTFYLQARDNREPEANRSNTPKLNIRITEPVSPEQAQKQLAQDIAQQEQQQKEAAAKPGRDNQGQQPPSDQAEQPQTPNSQPDKAAEGQSSNEGTANQEPPENTKAGQSKNNEAGSQGQRSTPPVKNDGSQDDEILRKLRQHQLEQAQPSEEGEQGAGAGAKSGKEGAGQSSESKGESGNSAQRKQGGNSGENSPEQMQNGEAGESQGAESKPGGKGAPGQEKSTAEGQSKPETARAEESGSPGKENTGVKESESSSLPMTNGAKPAPESKAGGTPSNSGTAEEQSPSPSGSSKKPGAAGMKGDSGTETPTSDQKNSSGSGASQKNSQQPSRDNPSQGAAGGEASSSKDPAAESSGAMKGDTGESSATEPGGKKEGQEKGGKSTETLPEGAPGQTSPGDKEAMVDETRRGKLDESKQGDHIETGPGRGEEPVDQPPREQLPGGENPNPGEGTPKQRSQNPTAGEEGAGQPNTAGSPDGTPGKGDQTSPDGPGNAASPTPQENAGPMQSGKGQSGKGQSGKGQAAGGQAGQGKSGAGESGQGQSGQGQSGEGQSHQGKSAGEGKTGQGQSNQGKSGQGQSGKGQSGKGQSGQGQSHPGKNGAGKGQSGQGQSGKGAGQSSGGQGQSASSGKGGGGAGTSNPKGGTGGSGANNGLQTMDRGTAPEKSESTADPVNEDYARQTANLVLKRLEEAMSRGEVDPALLKELGWTKEDMQRFAKRMRSNLKPTTGDETPRQRAQRIEFEQMLENMTFQTEATKQTAESNRVEQVEGVGEITPTIPSEYREAYKRFTRSVSGFEKAE